MDKKEGKVVWLFGLFQMDLKFVRQFCRFLWRVVCLRFSGARLKKPPKNTAWVGSTVGRAGCVAWAGGVPGHKEPGNNKLGGSSPLKR